MTPITCPLCEATCGLLIDPDTLRARGDKDDVFSRGYLCPKGAAIGELHSAPGRLRAPMIKRDGEFVEATWEEAFAEIERRLPPILEAHGRQAAALYFGNPTAHQLAGALYLRPLVKALGTTNVFSAGSVDQIPKVFVSGYLYGDPATVPIPDLDRTDHLLILGANPLVSNGSLMTAPDMRGRIKAIADRGTVVVVDPRRTRTAEVASEHVPIRPGADAWLLLAMIATLAEEDLIRIDRAPELAALVDGVEQVGAIAREFPPESVVVRTGIDAETIRRLARELAQAERAAVYGRMGTTTQSFGTLASWLIDVLNILTGNLDRPGGVMFPLAAAGQPNARAGSRKAFRHGRWRSRVSQLPEVMGELPAVLMAEEMTTPGEGRIRALVTVGGNPCVSVPGSDLGEALDGLEFMVSLDPYLNETTRHADVVLPGPSPLERGHYDLLLYQYAVRNIARWSPPLLDSAVLPEWHSMLRIAAIASGLGADVPVETLDDALAAQMGALNGVDPDPALAGPERLLDLLLRSGPYDLDLAAVQDAPHGIDLGPLLPRLPGVLSTADGRIDLVPEAIVADVVRLREAPEPTDGGLVLIGRRHLRSNNSWMHHVEALQGGTNTCTLQIHPDDARGRHLIDGGLVRVRTAAGELEVEVELSEALRPGVVSLPHGWGLGEGVNSNVLGDARLLDAPTGTAVVNGIPCEVEHVPVPSVLC